MAHLRAVLRASRHDPELFRAALRGGVTVGELADACKAAEDSLEGELIGSISAASSPTWARRAANEALLDLDARLPRETPVRGTCVRVSVLGTVLGVALLVAHGQAGTVGLIDVLAAGGAAAIVSWTAGSEAQVFVERRRKQIDALVEALLEARWGPSWARDQEQSAAAVQPREPGVP